MQIAGCRAVRVGFAAAPADFRPQFPRDGFALVRHFLEKLFQIRRLRMTGRLPVAIDAVVESRRQGRKDCCFVGLAEHVLLHPMIEPGQRTTRQALLSGREMRRLFRLRLVEPGAFRSVRTLSEAMMRSTEEVLRDHLDRRCRGDLDGDVEHNYSDNLVVLCKDGVFHGKDGIRQTAGILAQNLPEASFRYDLLRVADEFALLSWSGEGNDGSKTCHGADSFVVREGRIVAQTIHFEAVHGQ